MVTKVRYFMGIDCSTKRIDVVVIDGKKNWISSKSIETSETDIDLKMVALYKEFATFLSETLIDSGVEFYLAAVENPIYVNNVKVTVSIGQTVACVKLALANQGVSFVGIDNRAWKRSVLGDGNSDKEKIKKFATALWGKKITSQDIADASCIALWCQQRGG